jgi:protein arginine kinase
VELSSRCAEWLRGTGPLSDVVVSSRARLARNLASMPFLSRCPPPKQREVVELCRSALSRLSLPPEVFFVDLEQADALDRQLLVERHLVSRQQAEAPGPRGVLVAGDETIAVMINEEDHLRLQVLRGGLQIDECVAQCRRLDEMLEGQLSFAYSSRYGYLTACPTNVGTGLRVSVMLHLPALKMTGQIERVLRAARDMHLAIRGLHGEGTEPMGDFFQISNQTTLGKSEEQIANQFRDDILPHFIEYERQARQALLHERRLALEDRIFRAQATLRSARLLSSEEMMALFSHLRLGLALRIIEDMTAQTLNELSLAAQPAHIQRLLKRTLDTDQRGAARADLVRQRLSGK